MQEDTSTCASQYVSTYGCRVGLYIGTVWADVGFKKYLSKILRCSSVCDTSTHVHRQGVTHLTSDQDSRSLISLESHIEDMLTTPQTIYLSNQPTPNPPSTAISLVPKRRWKQRPWGRATRKLSKSPLNRIQHPQRCEDTCRKHVF